MLLNPDLFERRMQARAARVFRLVVTVSVLVLTIGADRQTASLRYPTHVVMVDGRPMRVRTAGLSERKSQSPVVVFEAGGGQTLTTWDSVFDRVAASAPAVAYDRRGWGESPTDSLLETPEHVAKTLKALLDSLHVGPPYVLVGHSWGGPLIRMFAALYPAAVAGMVYIDPTDLRTAHQDLELWKAQGYSARDWELEKGDTLANRAVLDSLSKYPRMNPNHKCQGRNAGPELYCATVMVGVLGSYFANYRTLPPMSPDVPVSVLMSALRIENDAPAPYNAGPCKGRMGECREIEIGYRMRWLWQYAAAAKHGWIRMTRDAGHMIQLDEPDAVVQEIERVLAFVGKH